MSIAQRAYAAGSEAAKVAFLGELYDRFIRRQYGPLATTLFPSNPLAAGAAGAAAQALDTPPGGSRILRGLGVGTGGAVASAVVQPVAKIIAATVASSLGVNPGGFLAKTLELVPTNLAQQFAATKGRDAAEHLEKVLKKKNVRVP